MQRFKTIIPRYMAALALTSAVITVSLIASFEIFDRTNPPPLGKDIAVSTEVVDADGKLLRVFATPEGRWRFTTKLADIDAEFLQLLIAYEDQRFWSHAGVDPRATLRAAGQLITNGRIVSGASTITMQLARLLEPRKKRSGLAKIHQALRALQIERRLSKEQILTRYLTLAPYGGNLEGIRAASLAYFGKEPNGLTLAQSALLVALPQSPERRRPDRFPARAKTARDTVLARAARTSTIATGEVSRLAETTVASTRYPMPQLAAHLAQQTAQSAPHKTRHQLTLKRPIQQALETVVRDAAKSLDPKTSIALILADAHTGNILAQIGSPNYLATQNDGWIDMVSALRSPGSALKPFIYAMAFEEGLARPQTMITDSPINFAGYQPTNFDMSYQGTVSVRRALLQSLNVPAISLLDAVGPARFLAKINRGHITTSLPTTGEPGLAIGLGGIGISLQNLTQLYTSLANNGRIAPLHSNMTPTDLTPFLQPDAAWHITDILRQASAPTGATNRKIAYKTGTSYGYRDAWSVGYDGKYVLGVWVGRPDNGAVPGITGRTTAAPILFEAFAKSGLRPAPFAQAPPGVTAVANHQLPITLQNFNTSPQLLAQANVPEPAPQIIYPPSGAHVELGQTATGKRFPLVVKLQDGRPPFRWLANGNLIAAKAHKRVATWHPDGSGFSTLTVIDANGRAASVDIFIEN